MSLLDSDLRLAARIVARGGTKEERAAFIDEAPSFVLAPRARCPARICRFDPEKGALDGWLAPYCGIAGRAREENKPRDSQTLATEPTNWWPWKPSPMRASSG